MSNMHTYWPRSQLLAGTRRRASWWAIALVAGLSACTHPAIREAESLLREKKVAEADLVLSRAVHTAPQDAQLRSTQARVREQAQTRLTSQLEGHQQAGRWEEAEAVLNQLRRMDPQPERLPWLTAELAKARRHQELLSEGRSALAAGKLTQAEGLARRVLAENPTHREARALASQVAQARPLEWNQPELGPAFQKTVTLELRDAPLRQVFAVLSQSTPLNFVFDKEVRGDLPVTVFLRDVSVEEALRVVLAIHQLERKAIGENALLIYPATAAKQREHQDLMTRTFYLTHIDVKQAQLLVKGLAKARDIYVDERLNLMVVRDSSEGLALVERLLASVDLPEPEVMLDVEVMEIGSDQLEELGLQWPDQVQYGLPGVSGSLQWDQRGGFRGSIAGPALIARLRGQSEQVNILANPKIRVRNREKAKVHIGQRVPVFTTTATANVGVSASVSYLDVGLKLDVEPTVQHNNEVLIRVGLEVSNLLGQVSGPSGATAYEIGTRQSQTTLKLADGETQVLAGLISDEQRKGANGLPGLASLPLLGRLFGVHKDSRSKTEVVLLITPRVLRSLPIPEAADTWFPAGNEGSPSAPHPRLFPRQQRPATSPGDAPR